MNKQNSAQNDKCQRFYLMSPMSPMSPMCPMFSSLCFALLLVFALNGSASAQDSAKALPESGLTVTTVPAGALVELSGSSVLVGLAPVFFGQGLPGRYKLEISRPGYETYRSSVIVTSSGVVDVSVSLKKRTRGKAFFRSLLFPGWGQFYSERPTKGALLSTAAVIAAVSLGVAESEYQDKRELFDIASADLQEAEAAGSLNDLPPLQLALSLAQREAYDAETYRRAAIGATVAVWGISLLDALLFFPNVDDGPSTRSIGSERTLSISPVVNPVSGNTGLNLSISF